MSPINSPLQSYKKLLIFRVFFVKKIRSLRRNAGAEYF